MRKLLFTALIALFTVTSASAQFEKDKWYVNASFSDFGLSYSEITDFALNVGLNAGYMVEDDWMLMAEVGLDCSNSDCNSVFAGAKCRYYIEKNGLFLSLGCKWIHMKKSINDFQVTPEFGYCFFLNKNVTIEPSLYYDISCTEFSDYSKVGLKVGLGIFF